MHVVIAKPLRTFARHASVTSEECPEQNPEIKTERCPPQVGGIGFGAKLRCRHIDAPDLSQAGYARKHWQHAQLLAGLDQLRLRRQAWTGSDQTHLAFHD